MHRFKPSPIRGIEEPKRAFENLNGQPWTEADTEMALAAEAAADAQAATTGEEEDLPSFTDNVPSFGDGFRRGFNADGGSYNAVDNE